MSKPLIRRETALTAAFRAALSEKGIDTDGIRAPRKTEPAWTVTRRGKRKKK